jgi:hypothetical protein
MITIDFSCDIGHRFSGYFNDYATYCDQSEKKMITCPLCDSSYVRRIYSGCSIQVRSASSVFSARERISLFQALREFNQYIRQNFEHVGRDFPDVARAIHYGIQNERPIYGEATSDELRDLADDGVSVLPLVDIERFEN